VGLVGASDDVVQRVQEAWLDRLQSIAALKSSTTNRVTKLVRLSTKVQSSVITSEIMMKMDLVVMGVPSLSGIEGDRDDESLEGGVVVQYLNGVYGAMETELANRIKRVTDNHRLWVIAGIES